jgi:hypothetical protein
MSNRKLSGTLRYVVLALLLSGSITAAAQVETIDARARGTSTQMGKDFDVRVGIDQFSTQEDRQALIDAFQKGGHDGLVRTLAKMKAVGRIRLPETTGFPIAYARSIPTPTGRRIIFATDRVLAFGENANNARSKGYDVTAGQIDINDQDSSKSTGVFYPAVKVIMSKQGEIQFELFQNPWKLTNIKDWTPKNKEQ